MTDIRMNKFALNTFFATTTVIAALGMSSGTNAAPYSILQTTQTMGSGGIDYVYADSDGRRLYIPRGNDVLVFDIDTLKSAGSITNTRARGVAVDPVSQRAFSSSSPVTMWNSKTLEVIKTIPVEGRPDGILFEPLTEHVYVLSHSAPNATVIDGKDGTIVGTIDLGGAPEQAASDGAGKLYVDLEDQDKVAVVDVKTLKVLKTYGLEGKGGGPGGLAIDAKNHILFVCCHEPATCVIMNADDGKIITTLPIGNGVDGATFNPKTMEAFSSQGDGTLTVIKENSPTSFEVEQTLTTKNRAKTCTLDSKTDKVFLITTERPPAAPGEAAAQTPPPPAEKGTNQAGGPPRRGSGARYNGPSFLDILVVGH